MRRIKRDFRQLLTSPSKFLAFCQKVKHALADNPNLPEPVLALLKQYIELVDRLDTVYHQALDGAHSMIRDRDKLSQEIALLLDQIASTLEAAFILNPDALLATGFTVTQERRNSNRDKAPLTALPEFQSATSGHEGSPGSHQEE